VARQLDDRVASLEDVPIAPSPTEIYERFAVPALFAPAARRLLAAARPRPGERVLDVGTGTGIVARLAAPAVAPGGEVTGLDLSPDMLAEASAAAAAEKLAIAWREGRAEALPFPEARFDLVLCQFALMFVTDHETALAEMRRVLAPDGRMALSVFQGIARHPFYVALDAAIARQLGMSAVRDIFALGDAEVLGASLTRAGFRDVAIAPFSLTAHLGPPAMFLAGEIEIDTASLPAMHGLAPAARRELVNAIAGEMAEPLRAVTDGGEVIITFHACIAQAHR
jgi:SAM-dependent methyltransferase